MMEVKQSIGIRRTGAFTLIELLIVVAIIAILAAIAVPNFLEAQTRAKASRARADLRSVTTGLESYRVDNNNYPPNDGVKNVLPSQLTTPIAYLTSKTFYDPFRAVDIDPVYGELLRLYTYAKIVDFPEWQTDFTNGFPAPQEACDFPGRNVGALNKYGKWRMVSVGPDRQYSSSAFVGTDPVVQGSDILYDPTNGTVSWGNILRTQKSPEGKID